MSDPPTSRDMARPAHRPPGFAGGCPLLVGGTIPFVAMIEALQVNFPTTHLEIKIVLSIMLRGSLSNASFRYVRILLCETLEGQQDDNQAAHHKIDPNTFERVHYCLH